jgi:hypothetical protein
MYMAVVFIPLQEGSNCIFIHMYVTRHESFYTYAQLERVIPSFEEYNLNNP